MILNVVKMLNSFVFHTDVFALLYMLDDVARQMTVYVCTIIPMCLILILNRNIVLNNC